MSGLEKYGLPILVEVIDISEVLSIGFSLTLQVQDASGELVPALRLEALMDEEEVEGYDRVGMGPDGFPVLTTFDEEKKIVKGRCFIVRRDLATPVPEAMQEPAKALIGNLMAAVNRYYAFGSCFSEEF